MKRFLIISAFVLGMVLDRGVSFATNRYAEYIIVAPVEISGEVADYNSEQHILTIRGKDGGINLIEIPDPRMVRSLRTGDSVVIKVENGKAASIERVRGY